MIMDKKISYIFFILMAVALLHTHVFAEEQTCPRAFDKIYVCPTDIFSTFQGNFYISPTGEQIKVSSISRDCNGPYVILITRQCPACGRYCSEEDECFDQYVCPIWENYEQPLISMPNY
jgi:hypothetical protein